MGLPQVAGQPLIAMIGRLADQKGFDLVADVIPQWAETSPIQWVILGTGEPHYHELFAGLAQQHPDKVAVRLGFSNELAHRIEAGADIFLMPSRYEPCGLNQLYSLKYGTVPVVHATGGLADTITNLTDETLAAGTANGFSFDQYTPTALADALDRACRTFTNRPGVGATDSHRHAARLVVEPQRPRVRAGSTSERWRSGRRLRRRVGIVTRVRLIDAALSMDGCGRTMLR